MGKTVKNSDLVPKEALEQLKDLDAQLLSTTNSLKEMLVPVSEISTELSKSATNYKDLIDAINKLKTAEKQATETSRKRMDIEAQKQSIQEKIAQSTSAEAKELAKLRVQLQQQNQLNKAAAKEALAHANSIEAMRLQLSKLKAEWAKLDVNSDKYKQMTTEINKLNDEISKQEQSIGVWSRNVGNYASGFNMLQYNIQQVARELPSLTISASQFFLAISNNLPMLVDELKRAKDANKALREEGTKTVPVWKQLVKGIFSWQTALVVGITLLTAYGKEITAWVKGLFSAEKALDAVAEAQSKISTGSLEGAKNAQEELLKLNLLRKTAEDASVAYSERVKAVDELQRMYPDYLGNVDKERILSGKISDVYTNMSGNIMRAAKAKAIFDEAVKSAQKEREAFVAFETAQKESPLFNLFPGDDEKYIESVRKRIQELENERKEIERLNAQATGRVSFVPKTKDQKDLENIIKLFDEWQTSVKETQKIAESVDVGGLLTGTSGAGGKTTEQIDKERQALLDYYQLIYKDRAEYYKAIVSDERMSYDVRESMLEEFKNIQIKAIEERRDAEIASLPKGEEVENQRKLITAKAEYEITKIMEEAENTRMALLEGRVKESIYLLTKEYEAKSRTAIVSKSEESQSIGRKRMIGLISEEEYQKQSLELTRKYAKHEFEAEKEYIEKVLALSELSDEERLKFTEQLGDAELKYKEWLYNEDVKAYEEAQKKKEDIDKEKSKIRENLLRSSFELAKALLQRDLDNKIDKLDEESEANQEWRDEEAERIDRLEESGAISKEQADARKAAIDDQAQAREEEIEKKKVEAQRRMAIYEKATSIAQVAINTAQSISKTLALLGMPAAIPFIAMAAAAGAAQTAAIVATPLPQYEEGTMDHPGGLAIVGDGGRSEMIIANGKYYKTPATDTLVDLPKHAIVLPDFNKAAEKLPDMPNVGSVVNVDFSRLEASTAENGKILKAMARRMEINAKNEIYEREFNRLKPSKR